MRIKYKTVTISEKKAREIGGLDHFPSAGPHPSVTGMKKHYWGNDALCVRVGAYVYRVNRDTYLRAGGEL